MKRMVVAASGWAFMGLMIYLMSVTARSIPQIWDPYEILGIPMVCGYPRVVIKETFRTGQTDNVVVGNREADSVPLQETINHHAPRQGPNRRLKKRDF